MKERECEGVLNGSQIISIDYYFFFLVWNEFDQYFSLSTAQITIEILRKE
jgi:hypothetical protein